MSRAATGREDHYRKELPHNQFFENPVPVTGTLVHNGQKISFSA
jgi:hypothetical protein